MGCGSVDAVVTIADLKERARALQAQEPTKREHAQQPPSLLQPVMDGHDLAANGAVSGDPLPIQSTIADQQSAAPMSYNKASEDQDWEKLPKQDEQAASLLRDSPLPTDLGWIEGRLIKRYTEMGVPDATETAQVHPFQFTTAIAQLAREGGVDIRLGARVTKINQSKTEVHSVEYEDRTPGSAAGGQTTSRSRIIDGVTDVVVAAGPWTGRLLPRAKVEGLRAHSVVYDADVSPYAVFTNISLPPEFVPEHRARQGQRRKHRGNVDPEIYARPGREVYACGEYRSPSQHGERACAHATSADALHPHRASGEPDSTVPLPETADGVQVDEAQCDDLLAYIGTVSPALAAAPVKAKQACYLPRHMRFGEERAPLVGRTQVPGLWVASGHTCWGIQNGPATGCLVAEMLLDGEARSADIEKLDPGKFRV